MPECRCYGIELFPKIAEQMPQHIVVVVSLPDSRPLPLRRSLQPLLLTACVGYSYSTLKICIRPSYLAVFPFPPQQIVVGAVRRVLVCTP